MATFDLYSKRKKKEHKLKAQKSPRALSPHMEKKRKAEESNTRKRRDQKLLAEKELKLLSPIIKSDTPNLKKVVEHEQITFLERAACFASRQEKSIGERKREQHLKRRRSHSVPINYFPQRPQKKTKQ
jgi:hypothetical protein